MDLFLDYLLSFFHNAFMAFIIFGWIFRRTLRLHLLCLTAILFSWVGLGMTYGWGYCFLTDWHWAIKRSLGETELPSSFISYMLSKHLHIHLSDAIINYGSSFMLGAIVLVSLVLNVKLLLRRVTSFS